MIRINLLETAEKKRKRRKMPSGAPVVALYVMLLVLEGLLLYYWSTVKDDALTAQVKQTQEAQAKLDDLKKLKEQKDELEKKMKEEEKQAAIFDKLRHATVGPSNLLLYLSYSLSTPPLANHAERVVQEQIGWDTRWDPDRAWFGEIKEGKEGKITIIGQAVSHHDTDEVLKRLKTCIYLQNVRFVSAKLKKGSKKGHSLVDFKIDAYVNYDPNVGKDKEDKKKGKKGEKGKKEEKKKT